MGVQIELLAFDHAPQPLDDNIIAQGTSAVHADRDLVAYQYADQSHAYELTAMIAVLKISGLP